jgi:hypothetical protein
MLLHLEQMYKLLGQRRVDITLFSMHGLFGILYGILASN